MNGLSNLDETYWEYSIAPTDDLIRFRRSKVKGQGHSQAIEVAKASTSTLGRRSTSSYVMYYIHFISLIHGSENTLRFITAHKFDTAEAQYTHTLYYKLIIRHKKPRTAECCYSTCALKI